MRKPRRKAFLWLGLILLLLSAVIFTSACEPGGWITFENQQTQEITISYQAVSREGTPLEEIAIQGTVSSNATKEYAIVYVESDLIFRIQAIDPSGKVAFSHDYKMADLKKIGWKIVIPPQ